MMNGNDQEGQGASDLPPIDFAVYSSFLLYQTPLTASFIAASHGADLRPLAGAFTYAQIGAGEPIALAALAGSYPQATFLGLTPDASAAARGAAIARDAGLTNLEFRQGAATGESGEGSVPACDVITLSGLYSAFDPDLRVRLAARLAGWLKPGGLLCLQYSALPGAATTDVLYHLLREIAGTLDGDPPARLRGALSRAAELARAGALLFQQFPAAAEILDRMMKSDLRLGAREVFNMRTHALYVNEVMAEVEATGLVYAGHGQPAYNFPELSVPPAMRSNLDAIHSVAAREVFLDYARNPQARVDIYAKRGARGPRDPSELLGDFLLFRLSEGPETLRRQQLAQNTGVDYTAGLYTDLLQAVGATPRPIHEVLEDTAVRRHAHGRALKAIQLLIGADMIALARERMTVARGPLPEKLRLSSRFNEMMLQANLDNPEIVPFSSTFTGQRMVLTLAQRLQLHVLLGGTLESVVEGLAARGFEPTDKEGKVVSKEDFKASVLSDHEKFRTQDALFLRDIGIIAGA